jgi:hypothetical protein
MHQCGRVTSSIIDGGHVLSTGTGWLNRFRFEPVLVFKKNWFDYFFLIKTEPNRK